METAVNGPQNLAQLQPQNFLNEFNMLFPSNPFSFDPTQLNLMNNAVGQFQHDVNGDDEDLITDEDFQKKLTDQEKTIFQALVIAINQTHIITMKKFH